MEVEADENDHDNTGNTEDSGRTDRYVAAVYEEAEDHSQNDEQERDHRGGKVGLKGGSFAHDAGGCSRTESVGDDGRESGYDQKQCQITEDNK